MMDEPKALNSVADFHRTFDLPVLSKPTIPAKERCELRINLLQEELDELKAAIEDNDIVEIADALSDIQYVLSGAVLEFGLGGEFKKLFDEVQRSNMSKVCPTMEVAEQTLAYYKNDRNTEGYIQQKGDVFLVYRKSDQKVLKSVEYSPADLKGILERRNQSVDSL